MVLTGPGSRILPRLSLLQIAAVFGLVCLASPAMAAVHKSHAITLYDEPPKYGADFTHFDYVNPDATVGGTLRIAPTQESSFDSFHPFIAKGDAISTGSVETQLNDGEITDPAPTMKTSLVSV